jgi:Ion channel
VLLFVLQGMVEPTAVQRVAVTALAGATLVLAFRAAQMRPKAVAAATAFAAAALAFALVRAITGGIGEGAARAVNAALLVLGPPAVAVGVVRDLRTTGEVRMAAVAGALSLYMLLGMFHAFVYGVMDGVDTPFFTGGASATVSHCLYFSFTTLTTVGYGDFTARTDVGHTLAVLEALVGQIYLVTVVSVIVSNLGRPARRRQG